MAEEEAHTEEETEDHTGTEVTMVVDTEEEVTIKDHLQAIDLSKQIGSLMMIRLLSKSEDFLIKSDMKRLQIFLEISNTLTKVSFLESDKMAGRMDLVQSYLNLNKKQQMLLNK